jgi:hypothetical protein
MTEKKSRFAGIADIRSKLPAEPVPPPPASEPAAAKMGRPPGKKADPKYVQVTVYLRKDVHRAARKLLLDDGGQFSDLVDDLVNRWVVEKQTSGSLKV